MATYGQLRSALDGIIARGNLSPAEVQVIHRHLALGGGRSNNLPPEAVDAFERLGINPMTAEGANQIANMSQAWRALQASPSDDAQISRDGNTDMWAQTFIQRSAAYGSNYDPSAPPPAQATGGDTGSITGQIQAFIDSMRGPLNTDPAYDQIMRASMNAAQAMGGSRGISSRSGLAAANASNVRAASLSPLVQARQQALAAGLSLQNQRDLGLGQLQAGYDKMQSDLAMQQWAAQQNQAQGIGSAIGAGAGALGFIGGPALGAATMAAGSAIGGGLGGVIGGPMQPSYRPTYRPTGGARGTNPYTGY